MTFLDRLNSPKFDFTQNRSGGKMITFQQSQALTSHFESSWSIVLHNLGQEKTKGSYDPQIATAPIKQGSEQPPRGRL